MLRLARPTPLDNARRALFGWLTDKPVEKWAPATEADLPEEVMALAAFRKAESAEAQILIRGFLLTVHYGEVFRCGKELRARN